jgi:hypothetical protein
MLCISGDQETNDVEQVQGSHFHSLSLNKQNVDILFSNVWNVLPYLCTAILMTITKQGKSIY